MNPQILSLMGIFLALILVVAGSLRGISIIILSSVAAFLVAATGGHRTAGRLRRLSGGRGRVRHQHVPPVPGRGSCWGAFWKKAA